MSDLQVLRGWLLRWRADKLDQVRQLAIRQDPSVYNVAIELATVERFIEDVFELERDQGQFIKKYLKREQDE